MYNSKKITKANNHIKPFGLPLIKRAVKLVVFFSLLLAGSASFAQKNAGTERVDLLPGADSSVIVNEGGVVIRRVYNNVKFRHNGAFLYCDLAIQNMATDLIEAYGNVKIVQGDTITVTGDTLFYYGNTRLAIMSGKQAVLKDQKRTLTSRKLEYDMASGITYYKVPGKTVDKESVLTSTEGFYDTKTKEFTYYKNVKLVNKKYTITTDTLRYNSITKWSYFQGNTRIVNKDGTLNAKKGRYNSETGESVFDTRTKVDNETYTLTGDSLSMDSKKNTGVAKGNVELFSKKDKTLLTGNFGFYNGEIGFSKVHDNALVKSVIAVGDTLFIRADTLYRYENKVDSTQKLIGYKNVVIYKSDFQGRCDSALYSTVDSTIMFFKKPILWSQNNQLVADSISAFMVNNKISRMLLKVNSFVIAEDTLLHQFNQVKGRTINAYFDSTSKLKRVHVDGNGQSAYYALSEDAKLIGLNRVESGKMTLDFKDDKVSRITFVGRPDGELIPPHKIKPAERQLEGFNWRIGDKPTKEETVGKVVKEKQPVKIEDVKGVKAKSVSVIK